MPHIHRKLVFVIAALTLTVLCLSLTARNDLQIAHIPSVSEEVSSKAHTDAAHNLSGGHLSPQFPTPRPFPTFRPIPTISFPTPRPFPTFQPLPTPKIPKVNPPALRDSDGDGITDASDKCPFQREVFNKVFDGDGCPDDGLPTLIDVAQKDINYFWAQQFYAKRNLWKVAYVPPSGPQAYSYPINTPCGQTHMRNAMYCTLNGRWYYDKIEFQRLLDRIGDTAPVGLASHEIAHAAQALLGRTGKWSKGASSGTGLSDLNFMPSASITRYSIQVEREADCLSGAWAARSGKYYILEPGDLGEARQALKEWGDPAWMPWNHPDAHGQGWQRVNAFNLGLAKGVDACFAEYSGPYRP